MKKNLIISLDDFGISSTANRNILELVGLGKINRVSVLANGSMTPKEINQLLRSGVKIDLHLDINFRSVKKRKLKEGAFLRSALFVYKYFSGQTNARQVEKQWEQQISKFILLFGKKPDGLNSHQHIHFFPAYFKILLGLSQKHNIDFIRFGSSGIVGSLKITCLILGTLHFWNKKDFLTTKNKKTTNFLAIFDWQKNFNSSQLNQLGKTVELVCHPEIVEEFEILRREFS